jgi:hypothetical protein
MGPRGPVNYPRVTCKDGFSVSIQVGEYLYSTPRNNRGPYTKVELGFPSEPLGERFAEYKVGEGVRDTETVFGYVPVTLVRQLLDEHGGEV